MAGKLQGKVAVITGGSSGIGLAAAHLFVGEGAHVVIAGRRQSQLDEAMRSIGERVTAVRADITDLEDLDRLYATVKVEHGVIDVVVASPGFFEPVTLIDATVEHFDRTIAVNMRGPFFTVQKALPLLRDGGAIVLVSSASHLKGIPTYGAYSGAKAAQRSFVRTWAAELKDRGIRVNALSPGVIQTPMSAALANQSTDPDAFGRHIAQAVPLGRIGQPEEMAKAVLFLGSDDSSYCTGMDLVADGGLSQT